jgi:hypothetical protein
MFGKSISRHAYSLDKRDAKMADVVGCLTAHESRGTTWKSLG